MVSDSCRQCTKRRILCDRGTPRCVKCMKKGIECSGVGRQFRFVNAVASRGKLKGSILPVLATDTPCEPESRLTPVTFQNPTHTTPVLDQIPSSRNLPSTHGKESSHSESALMLRKSSSKATFPQTHLPLYPALSVLNPSMRMLFHHCTQPCPYGRVSAQLIFYKSP